MEKTRESENKEIVRRFNMDGIAGGKRGAFRELVAPDFVDHTAPVGASSGEAMEHFVLDLLRVAIPDLAVDIQDQISEGDRVTTRKVFRGTFSADLLGLRATGKPIAIQVIDIFVVRDGRLAEHWGMHDLARAAQG